MTSIGVMLLAWLTLTTPSSSRAESVPAAIRSPDGRNAIDLRTASDGADQVRYTIKRDGRTLIGPSPLGPVLSVGGQLGENSPIIDVQLGNVDESFMLHWGKTTTVTNRCSFALVTLSTDDSDLQWQVELRAYDDGLAFRYRLLPQERLRECDIRDEATQFDFVGEPQAFFNTLDSFTTSHESLYEHKPLAEIPANKLLEMPLLLTWPGGTAAAITEARVRHFAGMYLQRPVDQPARLGCRLSPLPSRPEMSVVGQAPYESPWRVVLLADRAGKLLESNLLLCLNDPPPPALGDFSWLRPGKTSFHWWYGAFEDDYQPAAARHAFLERHKQYIDFCAANNIAYHAVSGDGRAWYPQSSASYATPSPDADVRRARPELELPKIIDYARERGVGIRLWVHWKPLSEHLEEAFALYQTWGVQGLMVDFLDRDDQEMNEFTERMLESAARHHLHIQIHGSPKYSGEQRTFPNLLNREGVMNLEYVKWSDGVTPDHNVNVAYTRALAGPVDYHLGGFRSVSRAEFTPRDRAPVVMGTRCHNLALYVVYENPMPMVADDPSAYEGQPGFDFLAEVPTTWDETRFLIGEPGEYVVMARRQGNAWYLGGITNWTPREIDVPLEFLSAGEFEATLYADGSLDESLPNSLSKQQRVVTAATPLHIALAPGGGFVAVIRAQ
ncbi:glycoside hydrolase family 97 protein [Lacipirellula limnantheis]|uniref:Retaining alpha-galactosidase n=1 Tax=Lacipirellula limnantheis TaxID=2528024 RepID=A0A517TYF8_9BACT|nr:glycoside hydrolase family 97 protein [Lacipirellula limnantheis]QDT73385.1 Retaining alpha-galactosidase precursor [Lacipirellula limnantheis]